MLIVSQNLANHDFSIPKDAIFRINLAWISNLEILKEILEKHKSHDIFLDLPKNRTKPPNNRYSMKELEPIIKSHTNIKYFAVSNVNSSDDLSTFQKYIPNNSIIVPKIESPQGVENIGEITKTLGSEKIIMLDHDDLYSSILKSNDDPENFQVYIKTLIDFCNNNDITLLRTIGVMFGDTEKRVSEYVK
jgi:citrate lyase beta subunit